MTKLTNGLYQGKGSSIHLDFFFIFCNRLFSHNQDVLGMGMRPPEHLAPILQSPIPPAIVNWLIIVNPPIVFDGGRPYSALDIKLMMMK